MTEDVGLENLAKNWKEMKKKIHVHIEMEIEMEMMKKITDED